MDLSEFKNAYEVVSKLRDPVSGCPWDLKQTHHSLLKYLIEESYEYITAVEKGDWSEMEEELGDILLQIFLHSLIGQEENKFSLESISKVLSQKIIRRHPHVFSHEKKSITSDEVERNWKKIKATEKIEDQAIFKDSLINLPSLMTATKIGEIAEKIHFDWENPQQVCSKVEEEWLELKEEMADFPNIDHARTQEELGDLLFSIVQLARHLSIDPDEALRTSNKKFIKRFSVVEKLIKKDSKLIEELDQKGLDKYWDLAKKSLKDRHGKTSN